VSHTLRAVHPKLRLVLLAAATFLAIVLVAAIVFGGDQRDSPGKPSTHSNSFDGAVFPAGVRAHDFTLTNQRGQKVSLGAYRGRVVMLVFLFSTCRTCALVANQVRGALDELEGSPHPTTLFVSTDPTADARASVSRFLRETSLAGQVEYLTGTPKELQPVWKAYAISPASAGKIAAEAGITVLLIDRESIERVGFEVEQITPEGLSHDIRLLMDGR
jgi:protein SCO1/2